MKLKRGDKVRIIAGKHKKTEGIIKKVDEAKNGVIIEGVNMRKYHKKANPGTSEPGKIVEKEALIHASNVALIHPKNKKRVTKISYEFDKNNKKYRVTRDTKRKI